MGGVLEPWQRANVAGLEGAGGGGRCVRDEGQGKDEEVEEEAGNP